MTNTWNAEIWKKEFLLASQNKDRNQLRKLRAEVFQDTVTHVGNSRYVSAGKTIQIAGEASMIHHTKFYCEQISSAHTQAEMQTIVHTINGDTLVVAKSLLDEGLHPAVLNMASRQNPGGGVYSGAGAQEENLFRRTNLFRSLFQFAPYAEEYGLDKSTDQYPLDRNWGGIYPPQACVFRGTETDGYPLLEEPYYLDFIAVPAINRPELGTDGLIVPYLVDATKNKMRTIFRIALANNNDSLVLGAMGCGAFRNPPAHVARIFHEVMDEAEFKNRFKKIVFAILDDHNTGHKHNPNGNLQPFEKEFQNYNKNEEEAQEKYFYGRI